MTLTELLICARSGRSTASQLDCHSTSCRSSHISITRPVVCGAFLCCCCCSCHTPNCRTLRCAGIGTCTTTGMCQLTARARVHARARCSAMSLRAVFAAGVSDTVTSHACVCVCVSNVCTRACVDTHTHSRARETRPIDTNECTMHPRTHNYIINSIGTYIYRHTHTHSNIVARQCVIVRSREHAGRVCCGGRR